MSSITRHCVSVTILTAIVAAAVCGAAPFAWQEPNATITPSGDLEWAPHPFVYEPGNSQRYIDYEGGSDSNSGLSKDAPWKHHPWDPNATGNAAAESGIHTYVFKRGVAYRGTLNVTESGVKNNPIRLTSDPDWGSGEAMIYGSEIESTWTQGANANMPSQDKVWYASVDYNPRRVWLVEGTNITRIPLARTPNWTESNPDDVKSEWWTWTAVGTSGGNQKNVDTVHLNQSADYYVGAYIWTEYAVVMSTPFPCKVLSYDASQHALTFNNPRGGQWQHHRYFLEDKPHYLDSAGEFWYDSSANRLYIRLPGDVNPNGKQIEVAKRLQQVRGDNISHLHVSGLTFRFPNRYWTMDTRPLGDPDMDNASITLLGNGEDLVVKNCKFEHVSQALRIETEKFADTLDQVVVSDNEIREAYTAALSVGDSSGDGVFPGRSGELHHVDILRNYLYRIGSRALHYNHGHAMSIGFPETAVIAGNILYRTYGAGIFFFGGKTIGGDGSRPLARYLIHHNRVEDPLLNANDWGGIETWQGGPTYLFCNISANPGGYWHPSHIWNQYKPASQRSHTTARLGFAFYQDGAFKQYLFNNVVWGKNNDLTSPLCNANAFQTVMGFDISWFNNTVYKLGSVHRKQGDGSGRNKYLNNLWVDISDITFFASGFYLGDSEYDYDNLNYAGNVLHQVSRNFGTFETSQAVHGDMNSFTNRLMTKKAMACDLGTITGTMPFQNAAGHDFRLQSGAAAIDYGCRVFVPWSLYDVVGEWHFRQNKKTPGKITDEHWNMKPWYDDRADYHTLLRNHLTISGAGADDFVPGQLDGWCNSALKFDGSMQGTITPTGEGGPLTADIGTNNFIIETYFKTEPGHTYGAICSKVGAKGYILDINGQGHIRMQLWNGAAGTFERASSVAVNDGNWHHVLVNIRRDYPYGCDIYIDGALAQLPPNMFIPDHSQDLTTSAEFTVGSALSAFYFRGTLEFLRIARGNLDDAKTTFEELYQWEFNGPQYYDFRGVPAYGARDAGAFEYELTGPAFVQQPKDVTIDIDRDATFRVFTGNASSHQWYKDGAAIAGATGMTYVVEDAGWQDQGDYYCVASDGANAATSDWATLDVVPEPVGGLAAFIALLWAARRSGR